VLIYKHIENLLNDLEDFNPISLNDIVRFVRMHNAFNSILMLIRNSYKSANYFLDQCYCLLENGCLISDIQLAGLLVIVADIDTEMYGILVSSTSDGASKYHWSKGMATSYLLHKEVNSATIRQSA
jgi:hypothetical protein